MFDKLDYVLKEMRTCRYEDTSTSQLASLQGSPNPTLTLTGEIWLSE
jgi:hypothetical protein